jgi:ATP-binding cassette subfamily F protein 3
VLNDYEGTFVVVSHDRYFLSQIANKIWWIENHQLCEYPGTYSEYEDSRKNKVKKVAEKPAEKNQKPKEKKETDAEVGNQKELKKLKTKLKNLEDKISGLKGEKGFFEIELAKPAVYQNPDSFQTTLDKFNKVELELKSVNEEWEQLFLKIDELESNTD